MGAVNDIEQLREIKERQLLEHLVLKYPELAMQTLALRGVTKFVSLYKEATGIQLVVPVISNN